MTTPFPDPTRSKSSGFLYLSLLLFVILAIACLLPIQPNDYWWYVRVGRDIASSGSIPTVEALSFSRAGQPVVYQAWLASLAFYGADALGGSLLTNLLRAVLIAGFYVFLWLALRRVGSGPRLAALLSLVAALAGSGNWAMRPQLFGYPLFGAGLWALARWQNGSKRAIWILPVIAALWVNLHGSFLLLFLLIAAALLAGRGDRRRLGVAALACLLASLINPLGVGIWPYVTGLLRNPASLQFSAEWAPPVNQGWQMNLFFAWLLAVPALAAFSPARPDRLQWLWFLGLGWMALSGLRYVIWFTAALALLSAQLLSGWMASRVDRPQAADRTLPNLVLGGFLLIAPLALLPGVRDSWWQQAPPPYSENTPVDAVRWLAAHPELPGPLFSELAFSSYLTAALPSRPVWIHTRFETFPPAQFERYIAISDASPGWEEKLDAEGIRLLMLSLEEQPLLAAAAQQSPHWRQVYRDEICAIFTRGMQ